MQKKSTFITEPCIRNIRNITEPWYTKFPSFTSGLGLCRWSYAARAASTASWCCTSTLACLYQHHTPPSSAPTWYHACCSRSKLQVSTHEQHRDRHSWWLSGHLWSCTVQLMCLARSIGFSHWPVSCSCSAKHLWADLANAILHMTPLIAAASYGLSAHCSLVLRSP